MQTCFESQTKGEEKMTQPTPDNLLNFLDQQSGELIGLIQQARAVSSSGLGNGSLTLDPKEKEIVDLKPHLGAIGRRLENMDRVVQRSLKMYGGIFKC